MVKPEKMFVKEEKTKKENLLSIKLFRTSPINLSDNGPRIRGRRACSFL
jgi:hypothetical protein